MEMNIWLCIVILTILLSPAFTGLNEMLKICEDFVDDLDIIFNAY